VGRDCRGLDRDAPTLSVVLRNDAQGIFARKTILLYTLIIDRGGAKRLISLHEVSPAFFYMILAALMIPAQVTLVPLYLMITEFKLINTFAGVMMPGLADVIGIFLLKQ